MKKIVNMLKKMGKAYMKGMALMYSPYYIPNPCGN